MRISDWSSDVCSSDLGRDVVFKHFISNKKRTGGAGPSWGCLVGGSLKRSGAAEGREPAGRSSRRRCSSSSSSGLTMRRVRSYPQSGLPYNSPKTQRSSSDSKIILRFTLQGTAEERRVWNEWVST